MKAKCRELNRENKITCCYAVTEQQQNETMLLEPNYDNRFAGDGDVARAGAANGTKIYSKQESKLKKIERSRRRATTLDSSPVFGARSGSKASQMASKVQISGTNQSKTCLNNGYRFVLLWEMILSFVSCQHE